MENTHPQLDYGTGEKKLGVYTIGMIACILLTLVSFWVVLANHFTKNTILTIIFILAIIQFLVQVGCFLRLNIKTDQSKLNVMTLIFCGGILFFIVGGSLWIMYSLNFNMYH